LYSNAQTKNEKWYKNEVFIGLLILFDEEVVNVLLDRLPKHVLIPSGCVGLLLFNTR
jgi:hypothetical protein